MIRLLALACALAFALPLDAQQPNQAWRFNSVESANLLFHGLAVVGVQGFSSLPLYDRAYAERVLEAKEANGVYPTSLDRQAGSFREAFENDSTFELLHFLPLYFGPVQPSTVVDVLTEVAGGGGARPAGADGAFASNVVEAVLRSRSQRRVLREFANALAEEWDIFLRDYLHESSHVLQGTLTTVSRRWNSQVAPAVAEFLDMRRMARGNVMVSDALGPEGRVFAGDPASTDDNVFAVSSAHNETGLGASAFLLKELCYPVASGVVESLGLSRDRVSAERLSGRLAVRCGAELLDRNDGGLADQYRMTFLAAAAASGITGMTFETAFPVEPSTMSQLRTALQERPR